jgi:hypothetical protein
MSANAAAVGGSGLAMPSGHITGTEFPERSAGRPVEHGNESRRHKFSFDVRSCATIPPIMLTRKMRFVANLLGSMWGACHASGLAAMGWAQSTAIALTGHTGAASGSAWPQRRQTCQDQGCCAQHHRPNGRAAVAETWHSCAQSPLAKTGTAAPWWKAGRVQLACVTH